MKEIMEGDITEKDMIVVGLDAAGLPVFSPVIEHYVDQLLARPVGTICESQEEIIEIWVKTRTVKIKEAYKRHGGLAESDSRPKRHTALGWRN